MITLMTVMALNTGCGKPHSVIIDPAFMDTLKQIDASFQKAGAVVPLYTTTDIQFGDTTENGQEPADSIGVCIQDSSGNHILIKQDAWNSYSDSFRKYLLAHEIGHCVLGLSHDATLIQLAPFAPQIPESIMNPESNLAANWALDYDDYYFTELVKYWAKS